MTVAASIIRPLIAVLLGAVVGASSAILAVTAQPVDAHLNPWGHTWPYTFSGSNCSSFDEVDPIQIVYYKNATTNNVDFHSDHHGGWDIDDGTTSTQYFDDHFCGAMDGQNADSGIASSRYHQRHWWNWDTVWETYSLATPHYEDLVWPECGSQPKHAVRENGSSGMPEGGFINAKHKIDALWHNWNNGGAHYWSGAQDWDNTQWMQQCDGEFVWGNGMVDFIKID